MPCARDSRLSHLCCPAFAPVGAGFHACPQKTSRHRTACFLSLYKYMYARAYTLFYPLFRPHSQTPHLCPKNAKIALCASTILDICQENAHFFEKHLKIIVGSEKSPYLCSVKRKKCPQTVGHNTTQARDLFLGNNKY